MDTPIPKTWERFWKKVNKTEYCWEWTGAKRNGYGQFRIDGKIRNAHIVSWEWENGEVPDGCELDHFECENEGCVRPSHLEPVPHEVNMYRKSTGKIDWGELDEGI